MLKSRFARTTVTAAACLVLVNDACANAGIPGPLIWMAGELTVNLWQWLAVTMFMCIFVEGCIYRYVGLFRRPLTASAIANTVSLIAGIPLVFLAEFDPTVFVLPTVVSIAVEALVLRFLPSSIGLGRPVSIGRGKLYGTVILANVVSNAIMIAYLVWLEKFHAV